MALTVKQTFESYSDLTPEDKDLPKRIIKFKQAFINKNPDHTEFFGGNLIGYPKIRWTKRDTKIWLEEVLLIDDINSCQRDLYECKGIEKEYKVSSNIFNLSIPWVMNVLWNQNKNLEIYRPGMEAALVTGMAFHLSAFMFRRFQYGSNPDIALSVFEKLNNRFDFKIAGSWIKLLEMRTRIFMDTGGKYPDVWQEMTNDLRTVAMCNEVNGNIRNSVNILKGLYEDEKLLNERILKTKKLGIVDGEVVFKDYIRKPDKFKDDMLSACSSAPSLIKTEITEAVLDLTKNLDKVMLEESLRFLADNVRGKEGFSSMIERFSVYMLELSRRGKVNFNSVAEVTKHVASMFRSPSTKNDDIISIKKDIFSLVQRANPGERQSKIPTTAAGVITYLTIRAMAINYYK